MSEHPHPTGEAAAVAPTTTTTTTTAPAAHVPEASHANPETVNAIRGFFASRVKAVVDGFKRMGRTSLETGKKYAMEIWDTIKNTSKAIGNTLNWNSERGLLNFKNTTLNPFSKEKGFALNPMVAIRRITAGITLAVSNAMGGAISLGSEKMGKWTKGTIEGVGGLTGVVFGDMEGYLAPGV